MWVPRNKGKGMKECGKQKAEEETDMDAEVTHEGGGRDPGKTAS